jgi:hypothetical protein
MDVHQVIAQTMNGSEFFSKKPLTYSQYKSKVKRLLLKAGYNPVKASYDKAGNCKICGEAGRCPGWHTLQEIHRQEGKENQ